MKYYQKIDENFEKFLRNTIDVQNECIDFGTLFRAADIQYDENVQ